MKQLNLELVDLLTRCRYKVDQSAQIKTDNNTVIQRAQTDLNRTVKSTCTIAGMCATSVSFRGNFMLHDDVAAFDAILNRTVERYNNITAVKGEQIKVIKLLQNNHVPF